MVIEDWSKNYFGVDENMSMSVLENVKQISQREINKVRHKWERVLFWGCTAVTVITLIAVLLLTTSLVSQYVTDLPDDPIGIFIAFIMIPVTTLIVLYKQYAKTRAYSIRISDKNFPEIYQKSVEFAKKLGLKKVPAVYIQQNNGTLNAFASSIIKRRFVQLNAEIVDIAYMEHRDFDAVYFVMGHEFGHQYCGHATFPYLAATFIGQRIPILGTLLTRSQEYSADRIAQLLMDKDCVDEAMLLLAGRHLYKYVDKNDYLEEARTQKGFFLCLTNLMASHPIMPKRIAALADPAKKSGKLL